MPTAKPLGEEARGEVHPATSLRERRTEEDRNRRAFPITGRAILIGLASIALLGLINPYLAFVSRTWSVGSGSLLNSPVVVLFLLVAINTLVLRLLPGRGLTRAELVVVYAMLIVAVGLAMQGGMPYIVSATVYPFYMASPENGWEHMIWPHIPLWLRPTRLETANWFWESLPEGVGVPWADWVSPLLGWSSFTLALMTGMFCLGALMSKDWIERQRLAFPLADVPLAVTGGAERPSLGTSLLRDRVLWIGFAIPSLLAIVQFLHAFYPSIPATQIYDVRVGRYFAGMGLPWRALSEMSVSIIFPVIGITCLLPGEVSLSLWLFYVLFLVQLLVFGAFGIAEEGGTSAVGINPRQFIGFEEAGGFIALSAAVIYQSRHSIRAAWRTLVGRERPTDDPWEPLAGKWALVGFVAANAFMLWWALHAGMVWWAFLGILGVFYAVLVGASRLVAAGGVMYVDTGFFPRGVILRTVGALPIGSPTLTMYSYLSVIYMYDPMNLAMPQMMNSMKLLHSADIRAKRFPWAAALGVAVLLAVGLPALLWVVYHWGASALNQWPFTSYPQWAFGELDSSLRAPEMADNWLRLALVIGGAFTLLLVWLNTNLVWWPVSPVGFLIASSYETNRSLWVNVFIAWAITTLVRRYGGLRLYRQMRPAFLGLVLGAFLTQGALAILASVFGLKQPVG